MQKHKLYVGNLPYSVTETEVEELMKQHGEVVNVKIIEGKGFGFVEMSSEEEVEKVKNGLNGQDFNGRPLRIDNARPPKQRNDFASSLGSGFKKY